MRYIKKSFFHKLSQLFVFIFLINAFLLGILHAEEIAVRTEIISSTENSIVCDVYFDSVIVIQKRVESSWYSDISFPGCSFTEKPDLPRLPVTSIVLGIPETGLPIVSVLSVNSESRSLGAVLPVFSNDHLAALLDENTLPKSGVFPAAIAETGVTGFVRDQKIVQVELHPVRYFFDSGLTQIIKNMRIEVKLNRGFKNTNSTGSVSSASNDPRFESLYKSLLTNYDNSRLWRKHPGSSFQEVNSVQAVTAPFRYKLIVEQDGLYAVTGRELVKAGVDLNTISTATLALYNRDTPVPFWVEGDADGALGPDDRILFLGEHNPGDSTYYSFYSESNVYWLTWGGKNGVRYAEKPASPVTADTLKSANTHVHMEKDLVYDRLLTMTEGERDHWFWELMSEGNEYRYKAPSQQFVKNGRVKIRAGFQGLTHTSVSPDHHVIVKFNEEIIGDAKWDNQVPFEFESDLFNYNGDGGENFVSFTVPGDLPGVTVDRIYLNWVDIEFELSLQAVNDSLVFNEPSSGNANLRITGFDSPDIYILNSNGSRLTGFKQISNGDGYDIICSDRTPGPSVLYVYGSNRIRSVTSILPTSSTNLKSLNNGADYILITHSDFIEQAQKLIDLHTANGMRCMLVDVRDVFDEFGYGLYDPRAIKRFLKFAYEKWQKPAPMYVLLFGDTTHKMDKKIARQENLAAFVPTMMEYTSSWGMSSSDNYFACVSGDDDLPDLYIGRLPVNSPEQAGIMVSKTIEHDSNPLIDEWRRNVLLMTGVENYFEESAYHLYHNFIPKRMVTNWVATLDTSRYFGSTEDVARYFNNGQSIVNFIGHGGGGVFSDAELFQIEDIERLQNKQKYPIVFSLTCFIGHFDNPEGPSLAEELLSAPDKGIVANFGSSGRAYLQGDFYLNNAIFDVIFNKNRQSFGEICTSGKLEMVKKTKGFWDHVKSYNLLGDPALVLDFPNENINLQLSNTTLVAGSPLTVSGTVTGSADGTMTISAFNNFDSLLVTREAPVQNSQFNTLLLTMDSNTRKAWGSQGGNGLVRAYFKQNSIDGAAARSFSVARPYISALYTEPATPVHLNDVIFHVQIDQAAISATFGQLDSLMISWTEDQNTWNTLGLVSTAPGLWKTQTTVKKVEGITITYRVMALVNNEFVTLSDTKEYQVGYRSDLYIDPNSVQVYGEDQAFVSAIIKNIGLTRAGAFSVQIFSETDTSEAILIAPALNVTGLDPDTETKVAFIWSNCTPGSHNIIVQLDAEGNVDELEERNNRIVLPLKIATIAQGTSGELYSDHHSYYIKIPAGGVNKTTSLLMTEIQDKQLKAAAREVNLALLPVMGDTLWKACDVNFNDSTIVFSKPVAIAAFYNPDDSLTAWYLQYNALRIYEWNKSTKTWQGLESTINYQEKYVTASLNTGSTIFALMASSDVNAPDLLITIEGQNFASGDIISSHPVFTITSTDSSGFDAGHSPVKITLDGTLVEDENLSVFQNTQNKKQVTITWTPELSAGDHALSIQAMDVNGNVGTENISFSVTGKFELLTIANHPNPFADETIIAFTLSDAADQVSLDIYTVSGRMIRSFDFVDISGYVEQFWDGRDNDGNDIANGVYYLKFYAKKDSKKIERIEKMARLK